MTRGELLQSKNYWIAQLQMHLFETVEDYLKDNNITRSEFADQIGVNKSYVTQILNGDFDHKISKYVELLIACGKVPIVSTANINDYISKDAAKAAKREKTVNKTAKSASKTLTKTKRKEIPTAKKTLSKAS